MIAAALESAGIPVEVRGAAPAGCSRAPHGGFGPVRILVPASVAADARAILAELRRRRLSRHAMRAEALSALLERGLASARPRLVTSSHCTRARAVHVFSSDAGDG